MMGYLLHSRSRYGGATAASLLILVAVGRLIGERQFRLGEGDTLAVPWVVLLPLVAASIIAATTTSSMAVMECGAARSMTFVNTLHLGVVAGLGASTCWWVADPLPGPLSAESALRNYAGFLGLALLGTAALGASLNWVLPILIAGVTLVAGSHNGMPVAWAWLIQSDDHVPSLTVAGLLLAVGMMSTSLVPRAFPMRADVAD